MFHRGSRLTRSKPVKEREPISKRLVSHELSLDDQTKLIRELLPSRQEQEEAKNLESGDALKFVELLDEVLRAGKLAERDRPTCTRYLARVCGWHSILPNSAFISNCQRGTEHCGGGTSTVWIGRHNGQKVIIKVLNFYRSTSDVKKKELIKGFCKEVVIWKYLSHPNILPFIGATLVTELGCEKFEIVSEFMENGDITTFIGQNPGVNRLELLKDATTGLSYLHSQRVIHGDLKGLNVLINKQRRACLADFGLTRITAEFTSSGAGESKGTSGWMSPEIIWPEEHGAEDGRRTKESDVYSLGILIYEVICGHRPFPKLPAWLAAENLQQEKFPERPEVWFTDSLWSTVESCWKVKPGERPTVDAVLRSLDEASRA